MKTHAHRWIVVVAIISVGAGAALSHMIEPGVRVEKIMLATNTPALRIFPATPGPYPIALLAHGNGGSKEMLFRFGEALAAAGFECYSVDLAGYGESPQFWSLTNILLNFQEVERTLGAVDVLIGHSMGGGVGAWSVRRAGFRPKLFIGVGAPVGLGEQGPPELLLGGLFEELHRPARLKALTNAQVVISPWSDHILEAYDPVLVRAAVKAACAAVGKPIPAAPTAWRWRFAGLVLGMAGALGLMLYLPELHPRLAKTRRFIVPAVLLIAVILTMDTWIGVIPQLRRIPRQLVLLPVSRLALAGLGRLRLPRWSLPLVTGILAIGCLALRIVYSTKPVHAIVHANHIEVNGPFVSFWLFSTLMCIFGISTLLLLPSTLAFSQAVAEVRALTGWLLEQGCPSVGLFGVSLGGWFAGLAATRDTRLKAVVLAVPGVHRDYRATRGERVLWTPMRKALEKQKAAREALDKTPINLTLSRPVIPKENILLIQGRYDLLVEAEQTEELWQK